MPWSLPITCANIFSNRQHFTPFTDMKIKRFLAGAAVLLAGFTVANAAEHYSRTASALPAVAQRVISQHFTSGVSLVKTETIMGIVDDYDVILNDGTELSFDRKGVLTDVETSATSSVPAGLMPAGITRYVKANHAGQRIVGLERQRNGWDVELANGVDIKFNAQGKFQRYDD